MRKSWNFLSQTVDKPAAFLCPFPGEIAVTGVRTRADWPDREERAGKGTKTEIYPAHSAVEIDASVPVLIFPEERKTQSSSTLRDG